MVFCVADSESYDQNLKIYEIPDGRFNITADSPQLQCLHVVRPQTAEATDQAIDRYLLEIDRSNDQSSVRWNFAVYRFYNGIDR